MCKSRDGTTCCVACTPAFSQIPGALVCMRACVWPGGCNTRRRTKATSSNRSSVSVDSCPGTRLRRRVHPAVCSGQDESFFGVHPAAVMHPKCYVRFPGNIKTFVVYIYCSFFRTRHLSGQSGILYVEASKTSCQTKLELSP